MSVKPLSALAGLALILAAGCSQQATREAQAKIDSLTQVATDRDRLTSEVALNARALSEIGAELSKVQVHGKLKLPPAESKEQAQRDSIVQRRSEEHTSELQSHVNLVC